MGICWFDGFGVFGLGLELIWDEPPAPFCLLKFIGGAPTATTPFWCSVAIVLAAISIQNYIGRLEHLSFPQPIDRNG